MKKQLFASLGIVLMNFIFFFSSPIPVISTEVKDSPIDVDQALPESEIPKKISEETNNVEENELKVEEPNQQTIATVSTYDEFVDAMNNDNVNQVEIVADINGIGTSSKRINSLNRDLSINANNHKLNIGAQVISLGFAGILVNSHTFKLSNANINNSRYGEGFVDVATIGEGKWDLEFSNITAEKDSVSRVAQAHKCAVTMSGINNISTYYENFELGQFTVAKDATYIGNIYGTDWAVIDYTTASLITDTAFKRHFLVDDGANVEFTTTKNADGKAGWPAIWGFYKAITIGVNANFKVKWGIDIIRANGDTAVTFGEYPLGLTILLKAGSTMDLDNTDHHDYPAINMDTGINSITMEPGATLKATSDGIYGAMAFDGGTNKFYANRPKLVDLKNRRANYKAFITTIGIATDFTIENTDVAYWGSDIDNDNNPTASFSNVKKINSKITNKWSSDPPEVATALSAAKVQRFATKYVEKGGLSITEVPTEINFGNDLVIPYTEKTFPIQSVTGSLTITDSRASKQNWQLGVTVIKELTGSATNHVLEDALHYKSAIGDFQLNDTSTIVEKHKNVDNNYSVSNNWGGNAGLYMKIINGARADSYGGQIRWDIRDVPA
ncbi:hypothetical protein RD055328_12530 [Companilactobacillus sp. RD055328]|uniref:pectate lyase-like adhesive domain-containing protein n=1 Tax=Companilactobacillus sp. RD055328 TaxID=2916634 RepID=UPI001FC8E260|nr:pectate lyase-like adhesive domain-containing protein [Companilactobacillus sp. RD055328]GKQ43330.1 hypothetical protein RD055328_12530 [Companilactobacillus sp. RD055328]